MDIRQALDTAADLATTARGHLVALESALDEGVQSLEEVSARAAVAQASAVTGLLTLLVAMAEEDQSG